MAQIFWGGYVQGKYLQIDLSLGVFTNGKTEASFLGNEICDRCGYVQMKLPRTASEQTKRENVDY